MLNSHRWRRTFPYPIYSTWFDDMPRRNRASSSTTSPSDLARIRQLTNLFIFFGATDTPMTEDELLAAHDASSTSPPSSARSSHLQRSRAHR